MKKILLIPNVFNNAGPPSDVNPPIKNKCKKVVDDHKSGERDTASCFKIPLKNFLGASEDEDERDGQTKCGIPLRYFPSKQKVLLRWN